MVRSISSAGALVILASLILQGCQARSSNSAVTPWATTTDKIRLSGIQAGPEDAKIGILLVHDWFGITPFTRAAVARLAAAGYKVVAVDLYHGQAATTHPQAQTLMDALDGETVALQLLATIEQLAASGRKIVTLGFSMGGAPAFKAALASPERVAGSAIIYGGLSAEEAKLAQWPGELLLITGSLDSWAVESAEKIRSQLDGLDRAPEYYLYPNADHAFAQPLYNGGRNYDDEATQMMWLILEHFLARISTRV